MQLGGCPRASRHGRPFFQRPPSVAQSVAWLSPNLLGLPVSPPPPSGGTISIETAMIGLRLLSQNFRISRLSAGLLAPDHVARMMPACRTALQPTRAICRS